MSNLFKEKGLEAHSDKTCYIVFGDIKYKKEIDTRLEQTPLYIGDFKIKRRIYDRYLGHILHSNGVRASADATIVERAGKIKGQLLRSKQSLKTFKCRQLVE